MLRDLLQLWLKVRGLACVAELCCTLSVIKRPACRHSTPKGATQQAYEGVGSPWLLWGRRAPQGRRRTSSALPMASVPSTASVMSTCVSMCPAVSAKHRSSASDSPARQYTPAVAAAAARCASSAAPGASDPARPRAAHGQQAPRRARSHALVTSCLPPVLQCHASAGWHRTPRMHTPWDMADADVEGHAAHARAHASSILGRRPALLLLHMHRSD